MKNNLWLIIFVHQVLFQAFFIFKNVTLKKKIKIEIRGKNKEASYSILFFIIFITISIILSFQANPVLSVNIINSQVAIVFGIILLFLNMIFSILALITLKDSWRVGVIEEQKTKLITNGIFQFSRNPYFVSYILMFFAYSIILQNIILLFLSMIGSFFVHSMIKKEEQYLATVHGSEYTQYKEKVPRYILF
jgi:protein-S-isoprenylcysteine O-methyltransferase Ste14